VNQSSACEEAEESYFQSEALDPLSDGSLGEAGSYASPG
jgi:hypothetical protein